MRRLMSLVTGTTAVFGDTHPRREREGRGRRRGEEGGRRRGGGKGRKKEEETGGGKRRRSPRLACGLGFFVSDIGRPSPVRGFCASAQHSCPGQAGSRVYLVTASWAAAWSHLAGSRGGLGLLCRRRAHCVCRTAAGLPRANNLVPAEVGARPRPKSPRPQGTRSNSKQDRRRHEEHVHPRVSALHRR